MSTQPSPRPLHAAVLSGATRGDDLVVVLPKEVHNVLVHHLVCVYTPNEVQVVIVVNICTAGNVGQFGDETGNILWVCQPVVRAGEKGNRHGHFGDIISRRRGLVVHTAVKGEKSEGHSTNCKYQGFRKPQGDTHTHYSLIH